MSDRCYQGLGSPSGTSASVAVIVRTKDRPLLLRRALDDVLAQEYADWHVVLVNDGGDPSPVNALVEARWPSFDGRITVLHNEGSGGMEAASNQAIRTVRSEYVAIHDDDDTWSPSFLVRTVRHLSQTGKAAVAVRTEIVWERVESDGEIVETGREVFLPDLVGFHLFDLLRHNHAVPISLLYRRAVHESIGEFDERLEVVGDWEFHLRLAQRFEVGFLDGPPLAFWHQRRHASGDLSNSVISRADAHRVFDRVVRDEALREHIRRNGAGELLYLSRFIDERAGELLRSLDGLRDAVDEVRHHQTAIEHRLAAGEAGRPRRRGMGRWRRSDQQNKD